MRVFFALAAVTVLMVGCASKEQLSSQEFIQKADLECTKTAQQLKEVFQSAGVIQSAKEEENLLRERIPVSEQGLTQLQQIEYESDEWKEYLDVRERIVENLRQIKLNPAREELYSESEELNAQADQLGENLGLAACAQALSSSNQIEVKRVVEDILMKNDPKKSCSTHITPTFLQSNFASSEEFCKSALQTSEVERVEFIKVQGVDEVSASVIAQVHTHTGSLRVRYELYYNDIWQIDALSPA